MVGEVWRIGDVKISRIVEIEATGGMTRIIPDASRERVMGIRWLYPNFADEAGRMRGAIHALLVETPDLAILVDTCIGNDKERIVPAWNKLQTAFLDDLKTVGRGRDEIDRVLCTHLHTDHVGWNTMWDGDKWVPTFPNARYLFGAKEFAHWRAEMDAAEDNNQQAQVMADSVLPVWDAGLVDLVEQDAKISDEVTLIPSPGHTPGHASVFIESAGETALITGDFLHHPVQFAHPEWSSSPDVDRPQAIQTRRTMYNRFAGSPTLIIGTHFATPTAGYLKQDGDAWRLDT